MKQTTTLTKDLIVAAVATKFDMPHTNARSVVQSVLDTIQEALVAQRKVELRNFGVFRVVRRAERKGRNPANPEAGSITIPAKNVVKFKVGVDLDRVINPG